MENINIKNVIDVLKDRVNKISGSNKSKAKLSVIDKIKQKYYSAWVDYAEVKIEDLQQENENIKTGMEVLSNKIDVDDINELKKMDKEYISDKKELEKNNKKIEDLKIIAEDAQEKLDKMNSKVEQQEENPVEPIAKVEPAPDELVEQELKSEEENLKNDVESMSMEEVKQETKLSPVEEMLVNYRMKTDDLLSKYTAENGEIFSKYVSEKEKIFDQLIEDMKKNYADTMVEKINQIEVKAESMINERDAAIANLNNQNKALATELSITKQTLEQTKFDLAESNNKVNEQAQAITELNLTVNAKNEEINAKDAEIARIKPYEETFTQMSARLNNISSNINEEAHAKTL